MSTPAYATRNWHLLVFLPILRHHTESIPPVGTGKALGIPNPNSKGHTRIRYYKISSFVQRSGVRKEGRSREYITTQASKGNYCRSKHRTKRKHDELTRVTKPQAPRIHKWQDTRRKWTFDFTMVCRIDESTSTHSPG